MATLKYKDPILGWQTLAIDGGVTDVQIIPAAYGESPSARITAGTLYITWPADLQLDSTLSSASAAAPADKVGEIKSDLTATKAMLAPNYSDLTPPILVGQHCIHNGGYYECTTEITTAEAWTAEHWTQVTVGGENADLKSATDALMANQITVEAGPSPIVSISDGAVFPALDLTIGIEPVQSGSGDPSPDNVRPITGWTGANVVRCGENIIPPFVNTEVNGVTLTVSSDGTATLNGLCNKSGNIFITCSLKAGSYKLNDFASGTFPNDAYARTQVYVESQSVTATKKNNGNSTDFVAFTLSSDADDVAIRIRIENGFNYSNCKVKPMVVLSSESPTSYAPYTGTTYPISWQTEAGTVYGGTLDVTTGVLTVDRAIVDLGTLTWVRSTSYTHCVLSNSIASLIEDRIGSLCSKYPIIQTSSTSSAITNAPDYTMLINKGVNTTGSFSKGAVILKDSSLDGYTKQQIATALTGVQLVYKLSTPVTYQLTPTEVTLLLGDNNVWADTGDTTIEYRADTEKFIERYVAAHDVDVQIDGTSIVNNSVANIPLGAVNTPGLVYPDNSGISVDSTGKIKIYTPTAAQVKTGTSTAKALTLSRQHEATFYGLAKAAGDTTQSASSNAVGTYTETALSKIHDMLDAPVSVSGATPSITAMPGVRYICGECATLAITAPESGIIDVVFQSGSTPTVLTVTSAKTGVPAIKWANGFDPTSLDADTTYEINIMDGEYGVVGKWT